MPRGVPKSKEDAPPDLSHQLLFLQAVRDMFPTLRLHSDAMLIKKLGEDRVADLSLELESFLTESVSNKLTKNEKLALANQVFKCLKTYITTNLKLPLTPKTLLDCMSLLGEAVNDSFPGYAEAHILHWTITPSRISQ